MSTNINKQLIDNISLILKRSLSADATLSHLRSEQKANFQAIFSKDSGFSISADTFQPYVEEVADDLLQWQQTQSQDTLVSIVQKIEQLFKVLASFEANLTIEN